MISDATQSAAASLFANSTFQWLSEQEEAANHALDKHFVTFYQSEKQPTDSPKGVPFVAQCGMSGVILTHRITTIIRTSSASTRNVFRECPSSCKSRVKIVKDEAVVKNWVEDQSFRTSTCLNVPETIKLNSRSEVKSISVKRTCRS